MAELLVFLVPFFALAAFILFWRRDDSRSLPPPVDIKEALRRQQARRGGR